MGRFITVVAACSQPVLPVGRTGDPGGSVDPTGRQRVPTPEGPAPAWIVADMDTGQVLAERDMNVPHPPASTIKTLLVLTALDELPKLDATVVGTEADTQVECNCAGIKPGRTYTARQLLDAILLMSGNDAANALADMIGGYDTAVAKMNAKAASIGALGTHAATPSGLDGPGGSGAPRRTTWRSSSAPRWPTRCSPRSSRSPRRCSRPMRATSRSSTRTSCCSAIRARSAARPDSPTSRKKTFVAAADRGGRRLVIAMMYGLNKEGGPTYWDQATGLFDWGFAQDRQMSVGSL